MAIIYSYPLNDDIKLLDELVGTTEKNINGQLKTVTRNFLLADLAEFFIVDGGIQKTITVTTNGISGPSTLDQVTGILNIPQYVGGPGTGVTDVTASSPITSTGGNTPDISTSMATGKLIGRWSVGTGVMEEITIGTGLTLSESGELTGVAAQNLQSVTDEGSTTTNSITANSFIKQDGTGANILLDDGSTIPLTNVGNQDLQSVLDNGNTSTTGISLYIDTASTGLLSTSLDGIGIFGTSDSSIGVQASSNNLALQVLLNDNTITGVNIESSTDATGAPLKVTKNDIIKLSINQEGEITATKLIKEGGDGDNILLDNGDTVALSSKENSLGNPAQDGYVLSSTTTGTRSWVAQAAGFEANFLLMGA
jgi:hypothetical protein